jgi:hypothetical protein
MEATDGEGALDCEAQDRETKDDETNDVGEAKKGGEADAQSRDFVSSSRR